LIIIVNTNAILDGCRIIIHLIMLSRCQIYEDNTFYTNFTRIAYLCYVFLLYTIYIIGIIVLNYYMYNTEFKGKKHLSRYHSLFITQCYTLKMISVCIITYCVEICSMSIIRNKNNIINNCSIKTLFLYTHH